MVLRPTGCALLLSLLLLPVAAAPETRPFIKAVDEAYRGGDFKAAERLLRNPPADKDPSFNLDVGKRLAKALANLGRYGEALEVTRATLAKAPDDVSIVEMEHHYRLAARWRFPAEALRKHGLARWHMEAERYESAIELYEQALAIAPGFADSHYHLGWSALQRGDVDRAEREYRLALAGYGPGEAWLAASVRYSLAQVLAWRRQRPFEAIPLLRTALKDGGTPGPVLYELVMACREVKDAGCARAAAIQAANLPKSSWSHWFGKDAGEAWDQVELELAVNGCIQGGEPASYAEKRCASAASKLAREQGIQALQDGKEEVALALFRRAAPDFPLAAVHAAEVLQRTGLWPELEATLRPVMALPRGSLGPADAAAKSLLALALVKQEKSPVDAVRLATEAARSPGTQEPQARAWHALLVAKAYKQAGNRACAEAWLESVAAIDGADAAIKADAISRIADLPPRPAGPPETCFGIELYKSTTLAESDRAYWRMVGPRSPTTPAEALRVGDGARLRLTVRWTGELKPLTPEQQQNLALVWKANLGGSSGLPAPTRAVEVKQGARSRWLPIHEGLVDHARTWVKPGDDLDLLVDRVGDWQDEVVLLVNGIINRSKLDRPCVVPASGHPGAPGQVRAAAR